MSVNMVEPRTHEVLETETLPVRGHPEPPVFRDLEGLRSRHRIGGRTHERLLHFLVGLGGTVLVFALLYASILLLE